MFLLFSRQNLNQNSKWTIFEISFLWKHQSLCFYYWDYLTNFWHNNWRSIIDLVERFSYLMNELWNEYFLSKNMKNGLAGKTCVCEGALEFWPKRTCAFNVRAAENWSVRVCVRATWKSVPTHSLINPIKIRGHIMPMT